MKYHPHITHQQLKRISGICIFAGDQKGFFPETAEFFFSFRDRFHLFLGFRIFHDLHLICRFQHFQKMVKAVHISFYDLLPCTGIIDCDIGDHQTHEHQKSHHRIHWKQHKNTNKKRHQHQNMDFYIDHRCIIEGKHCVRQRAKPCLPDGGQNQLKICPFFFVGIKKMYQFLTFFQNFFVKNRPSENIIENIFPR